MANHQPPLTRLRPPPAPLNCLKQDNENSAGGTAGGVGNVGDGLLPPSFARAWRTFDVAKQIEYETKEQQKSEKAKQQKIM